MKKKYCHFCSGHLIEKLWEGRVRLFCNHCNMPIYENPTPATCLVVPDNKDRVLLVKRSVDPKKGYWCLPGGFMELGETPEESALRELKEETGLSGEISSLLGVVSAPSALYDTILMLGYSVSPSFGTLIAGDDASDVAYFHSHELPEIAFDSHAKFIRIYYANSRLQNT
ncbi:NUDIX hydrolase [Desulfonema magnum]|uniref:NUDIX hydrolase domain-containing protein n=1 Tax=Desulfonema magnum TaxID=45655 RepID=A0A975GRS5_9BACT|nr:NUDIX domain-containing protein [Desulfonema magnum]QTA90268.1 NUDIX hydrolase domain-containing protein [Desulfonema magnum]